MDKIYIKNRRKKDCFSIKLLKTDGCDPSLGLAGAVFDLFRREQGEYKVVECGLVTDHNGCLVVKNLDNGEYKFVETQAPNGYMIGGVSQHTVKLPDDCKRGSFQAKVQAHNYRFTGCQPCCAPCSLPCCERGCGCDYCCGGGTGNPSPTCECNCCEHVKKADFGTWDMCDCCL